MDGGSLHNVSLDDKYQLESGRVFISGTQALVRLPIMQQQRDRANGLKTAGFISGYRGSPIGGYDNALWAAKTYLEEHDILFQPGLNEDLAATAIWGTQQLDFVPGPKVDGVFSIWYGKGPGVDRSGDPLKHINYNGTHRNGGVLVVFGDDHPGKSSSIGHQSDPALAANSIPVLFPATVQEYLDYGLHGIALSRFAAVVVGFKCVNETVTATATVTIDPDRVPTHLPQNMPLPEGGIHIRPEYDPLGQDERMVRYKLPRGLAYARQHRIERVAFGSTRPTRLGIVTSGKAYLDCVAALRQLGIDEERARSLGIGLYKVGMVWPLEPEGLKAFASECDELLFVEEKRPVVEDQAKTILYAEEKRPRIVGKFDNVLLCYRRIYRWKQCWLQTPSRNGWKHREERMRSWRDNTRSCGIASIEIYLTSIKVLLGLHTFVLVARIIPPPKFRLDRLRLAGSVVMAWRYLWTVIPGPLAKWAVRV